MHGIIMFYCREKSPRNYRVSILFLSGKMLTTDTWQYCSCRGNHLIGMTLCDTYHTSCIITSCSICANVLPFGFVDTNVFTL